MRATAASLTVLIVAMSVANIAPMIGKPNPCCCSAMAGASCPLKRHAQPSCDDHAGKTCSLTAPADETANYQLPDDLRERATVPEAIVRFVPSPRMISFSRVTPWTAVNRAVPPELPPPRVA